MSLLDIELSSEVLVKEIIKNHFQYWLNKFPRLGGIVYDEMMNELYTEETWQWFLNNPNKIHIYWWDNYRDLRIYICKARKTRPRGLDWGYILYRGHYGNANACTLYKMIKDYEASKCL